MAAQLHVSGHLPAALPALDPTAADGLRRLHGALLATISPSAAGLVLAPAAGRPAGPSAPLDPLQGGVPHGAQQGRAGLRWAPQERLGRLGAAFRSTEGDIRAPSAARRVLNAPSRRNSSTSSSTSSGTT